MADKSYLRHLRNFIALTGSSNTLREHENISSDITPHVLFPWNLEKTFKDFIGNFKVAKKV